jgi:hypothetical protein
LKSRILAFALVGTLSACASPASIAAPEAQFDARLIPGAWSSAEAASACGTAPISYFFDDGTTVVFMSAQGALHAVGRWSLKGAEMTLTHNDAPFPDDGKAGAEAKLEVIELTADRFVTRSAATGKDRVRVRCKGLILPPGAEAGHGH